MVTSLTEPDGLEKILEPLAVGLFPGDRQRQEHILLGRQHREQVEELEDEADVLPSQLRDLGVAKFAELGAGEDDLAAGRLVQRREDVHERRLARARRAHDRGQLPAGDFEADTAKGVNGRVPFAVTPCQATTTRTLPRLTTRQCWAVTSPWRWAVTRTAGKNVPAVS